MPNVAFDDAAITFRYAARLSEGYGFTFNNGDRTNGASAPLYTLVLAGGSMLGISPPKFAAVIGVASFSTTVALVGSLAARISGRLAAVVAMLVLLTATAFQNVALSGMESGFAAALGLAALLALLHEKFTLTGVILGLALFNRIDALALVVPLLAIAAFVNRRAAARVGCLAVAVAAPWYVFATSYFGSPLPFSGSQKLFGRDGGSSAMDHFWLAHAVTGREGIAVFALSLALPVLVIWRLAATRCRNHTWLAKHHGPGLGVSDSQWSNAVVLSAFSWVAIHGAFYSLVNLGAPYPWYATVVFPVLSIGCGVVVAVVCRLAVRSVSHPSLSAISANGRGIVVAAIIVGSVGVSRLDAVGFTAHSLVGGFQPRASRALDGTRRAAGQYLDRTATPGEVVRTCFGWVAYSAPDLTIDESCPLNTRKQVGLADWVVESPGPGEALSVPMNAELVASFSTSGFEGATGTTFVYRVKR